MTYLDYNVVQVSRKLLTRLFSKIQISTDHSYNGSPCWDWTACLSIGGYGCITIVGLKDSAAAHRVMYVLFVGPIERTQHTDHLCKREGCVNPAHLEAVTPQENTLRSNNMAARWAKRLCCHTCGGKLVYSEKEQIRRCLKCRPIRIPKTHCKWGHPFSEDNICIKITHYKNSTYRIRRCRQCRREEGRRRQMQIQSS